MITNAQSDLQCLKQLSQDISSLQHELEEAEHIFTKTVLESCDGVNYLRLKLKFYSEEMLNSINHVPEQLKYVNNSNKYGMPDSKVQHLQNKLEKSVAKSGRAVKRSLMEISNLLSQYNLLCIPFYELKNCYEQLLDKKKMNASKLEGVNVRPNISYSEALLHIEEISDQIEQTTEKIETLTQLRRKKSLTVDYLNFFTNDFKVYPQHLGTSQRDSESSSQF